MRVGTKSKDALRLSLDWLDLVCRLDLILVFADLPRGDRGGVLDEYLTGLKIYNHSQGQLQTLPMQMCCFSSLATCVSCLQPLPSLFR